MLSRLRRLSVATATACLLLFVMLPGPSSANHQQEGVTFDSRGGNEWWVDLQLGGSYQFWGPPEVRDTNGEWDYMEQPGWAKPGQYVKSYHVEPGHMVKFRLTYKSSVVLSCWFTHPAGIENCDGSEAFSAQITPSSFGDNHVRVKIDSSQPLSSAYVNAQVRSGWSTDLTKVSSTSETSGTWELARHVPSGTLLHFSVVSRDDYGGYVESGCYRWPAATQVECPSWHYFSVNTPISYDGNLAHMEAPAYFFTATYPSDVTLQRVDVRFNGGTFHAMRFDRDDGNRYYRYDEAPTTRSVAQFRGIASDGQVICYDVGYFWPPAGYPDRWNTPYNQISFTNPSGNTGWVQTNLYSSTPVIAVEAQVNGGAWKSLTQQAWCDWAAAIDAPTGSSVRFRGFFPDFTSYTSEAMVWPPGTPPPPPPPPPPGFDATFTGVRGNEWWVQAQVSATGGTIAKVDVRMNGGAWKPVAKQSWGWGSSYHITQGTIVQLRATSGTGATDLSDCYKWLPPANADATKVTCPGTTPPPPPPPPPPGDFDATFSNVKGNEWWAEVVITANAPVNAVFVYFGDCSAEPADMSYRADWGKWVLGNTRIPAGTKVVFEAHGGSGSERSGGYVWPNATPTSSCPTA